MPDNSRSKTSPSLKFWVNADEKTHMRDVGADFLAGLVTAFSGKAVSNPGRGQCLFHALDAGLSDLKLRDAQGSEGPQKFWEQLMDCIVQ
jgi:hypothetical protein